jgi:PilZ domain-containing protein
MSNSLKEPTMSRAGPSEERRVYPRYSLSAEAEIVESKSRTKMSARVSDLSRVGCYVEMMSPFPLGAQVKMRIMKNKTPFLAQASVAYSLDGMGMGLEFGALEPEQVLVLEKWLRELSGASLPDDEPSEEDSLGHVPETSHNESSYVLNEIIIALMRKGILTNREGKAMLHKLAH